MIIPEYVIIYYFSHRKIPLYKWTWWKSKLRTCAFITISRVSVSTSASVRSGCVSAHGVCMTPVCLAYTFVDLRKKFPIIYSWSSVTYVLLTEYYFNTHLHTVELVFARIPREALTHIAPHDVYTPRIRMTMMPIKSTSSLTFIHIWKIK